MTAQGAYRLLCKKFPIPRVRGCLDYGTFFAFLLAPLYISDEQEYVTGTTLIAVDKKTGRIFDYDITSDIIAYENAKKCKVITMYDMVV